MNLKKYNKEYCANDGPMFSIVIPTYNSVNFISETIDSVFSQTYQNFELIIVNDGSSDGTTDFINSHPSKDRIIYINQKNRGAGAARNAGILRASGRYLAFLDSDDLWFPWALETYSEILCSYEFPVALIGKGVEFHTKKIDNFIKKNELRVKVYKNYFSGAYNQYLPAGTPGTVMERMAVLCAGGVTEERVNGEDFELFLKIGELGKLIHIEAPVTVAIRRHAANTQKDLTLSITGALLFIKRENSNFYPGGDSLKWVRRSILSQMLRTISVQCLLSNMPYGAWKIYLGAFRWHIRLRRFKYVFGFPVLWIFGKKAWRYAELSLNSKC